MIFVYIGIAIAALLAIYGVDKSRQAVGERRIEAKYAPLAEVCKTLKNERPEDCAVAVRAAVTGRDTCLAANKSLGEQFDTFRAMHNKEVEAAHDEFVALAARKKQQATVIAPKLADLQMDRFNALAAAKGTGVSCEQYDALLLKEMERKARDFGTSTEVPAAGPRIVEPPPKSAPVNPLRPKP